MPIPDRSVVLLDEQAPLNEFCESVGVNTSSRLIGCDTEFVRTNTYWPTLCLMQFALDHDIVCLDVLAVDDVSALQRAISNGGATWILHAAKQDLEAMHSTFTQLPSRIIDTQIAAGLLGHPPQIGYANLVEALLGTRLSKAETRTDWSRRPLTPQQLDYAAEDVAHLVPMHELLAERLSVVGRLDWVAEDCAALLQTDQYESRPDQAWRRIASIAYLPIPVQARARQLVAWRESRAKRLNRPRKWIVADKPLLQIAHANPVSVGDLKQIDDLPPAVIRNSGAQLIATCHKADADVAAGRIDFAQQIKPKLPDEKTLKELAGIVRAVAEELEIAPELLATRKELTGLLRGQRELRVLSGWRRHVIGELLLKKL